MNDKVDKSIERTSFYHMEEAPPDICPRCSQPLVQNYGPYLVATRSERELGDEFMMSGTFGYLCANCATAVFHIPDLVEMLYVGTEGKPDWEVGPMFAVLGLVNLDAIPPEQADVPIDELDDYPLVPYRAYTGPAQKRPPRRKRPRKPKRRRKK